MLSHGERARLERRGSPPCTFRSGIGLSLVFRITRFLGHYDHHMVNCEGSGAMLMCLLQKSKDTFGILCGYMQLGEIVSQPSFVLPYWANFTLWLVRQLSDSCSSIGHFNNNARLLASSHLYLISLLSFAENTVYCFCKIIIIKKHLK